MQGESGLNVEQHDSPSKPEDFVFVQGHRLVRRSFLRMGFSSRLRRRRRRLPPAASRHLGI